MLVKHKRLHIPKKLTRSIFAICMMALLAFPTSLLFLDCEKAEAEEQITVECESVYDGQSHGITITGLSQGYVVTYQLKDSDEWLDESPVVTNVSDASKEVLVKVTNTYEQEVFSSWVTLKIISRPVTITVDDAKVSMGEQNPTYTGSITKGSLVKEDDLGKIEYSSSVNTNNIGVYKDALYASYTENSNYDVTVKKGTLSVVAGSVSGSSTKGGSQGSSGSSGASGSASSSGFLGTSGSQNLTGSGNSNMGSMSNGSSATNSKSSEGATATSTLAGSSAGTSDSAVLGDAQETGTITKASTPLAASVASSTSTIPVKYGETIQLNSSNAEDALDITFWLACAGILLAAIICVVIIVKIRSAR